MVSERAFESLLLNDNVGHDDRNNGNGDDGDGDDHGLPSGELSTESTSLRWRSGWRCEQRTKVRVKREARIVTNASVIHDGAELVVNVQR